MSDLIFGAQTAQAEAALDRVNGKIKQAEIATRKATEAQKSFNAELSKSIKDGAKSVAVPGLAGGGQIGGAIGKIGEGAQVGGLIGKLTMATAALSVASAFVSRFSEIAAEKARAQIDIENKLADISKRAGDERTKAAQAGLAGEGSFRQSLALAGPSSLDVVAGLSATGATSMQHAAGAATNFARAQGVAISPEQVPFLRLILAEIAKLGGDVGQAGTYLGRRGRAIDRMDSQELVAGFMRESTGMQISKADIDPMLARVGGSRYLSAVDSHRATGSQIDLERMNAVARGDLVAGDLGELARTRSPESAMRLDVFNETQKQTQILARMAELQGKFYEWVADAMTPGGSFETQLRRAQQANGEAFAGGGER